MALVVQDVERQTLSRQVVRQITDQIVMGDLEPGLLLPPEKDLAEQFGVSRIVIRESVRVLAALGLVRVRHGVGTFVNAASAWRVDEPLALLLRAERQSLLNWLEVRRAIETGFAELAARRADPARAEALAAAIARMRSNVERPEAFINADLEFHEAVAQATANPLALTVIRPVLRPLRDHLVAAVRLPHTAARAIGEHEAIYQAIVSRDAARAADAMRAHLDRVVGEIEALHASGDAPLVGPTPEAPRSTVEAG